jgi:uncharacterized protein with GYD domain
MATYLLQASYTSEALASLVKNPQNRAQVVNNLVEGLGGKVLGLWLAFGDYDVVVVADLPDSVSAAAMALAAAAGGSLRCTKTTALLSVEDGVAALKKAAAARYTPVGS